jgi:hypothetical protein
MKYKELYEERIAICTIDGGLNEERAINIAKTQVEDQFIKDEGIEFANPAYFSRIIKFRKEVFN